MAFGKAIHLSPSNAHRERTARPRPEPIFLRGRRAGRNCQRARCYLPAHVTCGAERVGERRNVDCGTERFIACARVSHTLCLPVSPDSPARIKKKSLFRRGRWLIRRKADVGNIAWDLCMGANTIKLCHKRSFQCGDHKDRGGR